MSTRVDQWFASALDIHSIKGMRLGEAIEKAEKAKEEQDRIMEKMSVEEFAELMARDLSCIEQGDRLREKWVRLALKDHVLLKATGEPGRIVYEGDGFFIVAVDPRLSEDGNPIVYSYGYMVKEKDFIKTNEEKYEERVKEIRASKGRGPAFEVDEIMKRAFAYDHKWGYYFLEVMYNNEYVLIIEAQDDVGAPKKLRGFRIPVAEKYNRYDGTSICYGDIWNVIEDPSWIDYPVPEEYLGPEELRD